jgi:hypothetical protein
MTNVTLAKSNALVVGCSLSDYCGFGKTRNNQHSDLVGKHDDPRCWYNVVSSLTDLSIINHSCGGHSNREILFQTSKEILRNRYSWVIVQTTGLNRQWFWRSDHKHKPCMFVGGRVYNTLTVEETNAITEVGLNFSNLNKEIERDLTSLIMLQQYCKQVQSKMLIVNGMGFISKAKNMLPEMFELLDSTQVLNMNSPWTSQRIDYADDDMHPGEQSNKAYALQIIDYIQSKTKE